MPEETIVPMIPPVVPVTPSSSPVPTSTKSKKLLTGIVILLILLLTSGVAYASVYFGVFASAPYENGKFLQGVVQGLATIDETRYDFSVRGVTQAKDADAKPYVKTGVDSEDADKFKRDQDRARDAREIQDALMLHYDQFGSYPISLALLDTNDEISGTLYVYKTIDGGKDYTLVVPLESTSAAMQFAEYGITEETAGSKRYVLNEMDPAPNFLYDRGNEGVGMFSLFAIDYIDRLPSDLDVKVQVLGTAENKEEKAFESMTQFVGEFSMGDLNASVDAEFIKKGEMYYGRLNKAPNFFMDLSKVKGKWISFAAREIEEYIQTSENAPKYAEQIRKIIEIADEEQLVTVKNKPSKERVGEAIAFKYELALESDHIISFYEKVTEALKVYGEDALLKSDESTLAYLRGSEFSSLFAYLKENNMFNLWVDSKGRPVKMEQVARFVPGAHSEASNLQLKIYTTLVLSDINKEIVIEEPTGAVSYEEVLREITGKSKEEYDFSKQIKNVRELEFALSDYKLDGKDFPESLSLLPRSIPLDVYTKEMYKYTKTTKGYEISFEIKLPPYKPGFQPSYEVLGSNYDYESGSGIAKQYLKYVEGNNTFVYSNKDTYGGQISVEAELAKEKDKDKDGLPDNLETYLGTNPEVSDTDKDGYGDGAELDRGTNPLGPGTLEYNSSFGF